MQDRSTGWTAAALLLILAAFSPTVLSLAHTWNQDGMAHGWVVGGLVIWLAWRDRREILRGGEGDPLLLLPLAALSFVWLLATIAHIQTVHQTAFVLLLVFWGLALFGRGSARHVLTLGATLFLGLTVWGVFTPLFRRLTTLASGGMVRLLGIQPVIEGDVIHISAGTFLVENGCAGMNYFLSGIVVAAVYAHLLVKGWRRQLAVVAAAAAFAIVGNWLRVAALIVIGHVTEMQSGLMEHHGTFGWAVFAAGLIPFFLVARWIEGQGSRGGSGLSESVPKAPVDAGAGQRAVVATGIALLGPLLFVAFGALPETREPLTQPPVLPAGGGWAATEGEDAAGWKPAYQGAGIETRVRLEKGGAEVVVHHLVYHEQRPGAKLIGYPNQIAGEEEIIDQRVVGPVDAAGRRWVRQVVVATPDAPVLVWYWYRVGGRDTFSDVHAKALEVPAFFLRRSTAELIAVSSPCAADGCAGALAALAAFMGTSRAGPDDPAG